MNVLITASSGFIGNKIYHYFKKKRIKLIGIDKKKNKYNNIKNFLKIDLSNYEKLEKALKRQKFNKIIHLAALPGFDACEKNPDRAIKDNVITTLNLLEIIKKRKIKFIFVSSVGVKNFEKNKSAYAFTKKICENLVLAYVKNFGVNASIVRLSNVFGKYSLHKKSVIHGFIKNSLDKRFLKIHDSGNQLRDFIDAESVSRSFLKILFKKKNKLIIEICSGQYTSVNNLKILINKISGKKNNFKHIVAPAGYDTNVYKKNKSSSYKKNNFFYNKLIETYKWYTNNYNIK